MGRFGRSGLPGYRGRSGPAVRDLAKGGDDLPGVYRDWVSDEEPISTDRTAAAHHRDQRIYVRVFERVDLPGRPEICLCSGAELLLLPRGGCLLPHRGLAGAAEPAGLSGTLRRPGVFLCVRKPARALRLRLAVPLRAGAGPSL